MYGSPLTPTLTIADCVKTTLFASDHHVRNGFTFLPPLRCQFNSPVPIQHLQEAVRRVPDRIL